MTTQSDRVPVISGDETGREVMPEALRVPDTASRRFGAQLDYRHHGQRGLLNDRP